ncbi:MAG: mucoidy inhibitor MuiA family protein, partial [Acidobacteriota bacterium]|nr:mucoidy inhibitor MuiA family protein [Acidobacteriota bacterium]
MWKSIFGCLVLALFALPTLAEIVAEDATITSVTVYRDRAEVVREASVTVPAGESSIDFVGLPPSVPADSLRVRSQGVPVTLGAVELRNFAADPTESDAWKAAEAEVLRLRNAIAAVDAAERVDAELQTFLTSVGKSSAESQSQNLTEGGLDPAAIDGVYNLMARRLEEIGKRRLARTNQRRELQDELRVAEAKLNTLRPGAGIRTKIARVQIDARQAGRLTLTLAYLAPGASWTPAYRAALDPESGVVDWTYEGVVRQNTGEDWSDVKLTLSTASPTQGVAPPTLPPWVLREFSSRPTVARNVRMAKGAADAMMSAPMELEESDVAGGYAQAAIVKSAYNVQFAVTGRSTVAADGQPHTLVLQQEGLDGDLIHRTLPGIDPRAYLSVNATSPADYPLLAGPVRVFTGGAYLGRFSLQETGPDSELRIPFGVDNRVEITRVPMPKQKGRRGFVGKFKQVEKIERTLIQNNTSRSLKLILEDRIPIAEDERIQVTVGSETTPGA